MAWKKILVSGSQAELNTLVVDNSITANSFAGDGASITGVLHNSNEIASDISGSFTALSASIATRFDGLTSDYTELTNIPNGIISSSTQLLNQEVDLGSASISASYFVGDGSQLSNITVSQAATIASSFTNQTSVNVTHNFDSKNINVVVYDSNDSQIIPASVTLTSVNAVNVTFSSTTSGRIVVAKGGHIVSGSIPVDNVIGFNDAVVSTLPSGTVSGSVTSPSQGTLRVNGNDIDLGLQVGDTVTFGAVNSDGNITVAQGGQIRLYNTAKNSWASISFNESANAIEIQRAISPTLNNYSDLGTSDKKFRSLYVGDANISGNATITGDLIVLGNTTNVQTSNLLVEDKFILLNSGSANPDDGGFVIDEGSGAGHAFIYNSSAGRFGYTGSLASNATGATPDAFASVVVDIDAGHADIAEYQKNGNIKTDNGSIYIYS